LEGPEPAATDSGGDGGGGGGGVKEHSDLGLEDVSKRTKTLSKYIVNNAIGLAAACIKKRREAKRVEDILTRRAANAAGGGTGRGGGKGGKGGGGGNEKKIHKTDERKTAGDSRPVSVNSCNSILNRFVDEVCVLCVT